MGLRRAPVFVWFIWCASNWGGARGRTLVAVSVSPRFSNSVYEIAAGDDRARACQSPVRQLFLGRVLVPDGAACGVSGAATVGAEDSEDLRGWRTGECGKVRSSR